MHVIIINEINVIRDYVRHNAKDCDVIMKYNRNVIPKHIKNGSIRVIIRTPLL